MRRARLLLTFALGFTALCAPPASAAQSIQTEYTVVNTLGIPQADVIMLDSGGEEVGKTDGGGKLIPNTDATPEEFFNNTIFELSPKVTRSTDLENPCTTAPEKAGVTLNAIREGPKRLIEIPQLPAVPTTPTDPGLSAAELRLVGLINRARANEGMAQVTISSTLTASADRYLSAIPSRPLNYDSEATYCFASGPGIRAIDAGFPTSQEISEAVMRGGSPGAVFDSLVEGGYSDAITDPTVTLIGVANAGNTWVIDASTLTANHPYYDRAGDTGITGDGSLADVGGKNGGKKAPRLKFKRAVAKGNRVKAILRLAPKARGKIKVVAYYPNGKGLLLRCKRKKAKVTCTRRLFAGPWTIKARFIPRAGWRSAKAVKRVRIR